MEPPAGAANTSANRPTRLLDRARHKCRLLHYSIRTEEAYVQWIRRFILFHHMRHPDEMGVPEVEVLLSDLAIRGQVSASTQNQAMSAVLYLYRQILEINQPNAALAAAGWAETTPDCHGTRRGCEILGPPSLSALGALSASAGTSFFPQKRRRRWGRSGLISKKFTASESACYFGASGAGSTSVEGKCSLSGGA
jgi:hypothetical protein